MTTLNLSTTEVSKTEGGHTTTTWSGSYSIDTTSEWAAARWTSVGLPAGAVVSAAVLKLTVANGTSDEPNHPVWLEDSATPAALGTGGSDISGRTGTTANITWSSTNLGATSNSEFDLPDNTSSVQELVDSYGAIDTIVMFLRGSSSSSRDLQLSDEASYPAKYDITYTGGAAAYTPRLSLLGVG